MKNVKKKLIIVRHGNTFDKGQIPTRVGRKTDLPLSSSGVAQVKKLSSYLKQFPVDRVISSPLKRTMQTSEILAPQMGWSKAITQDDRLLEIDYGPDENKVEEDVIERIGKKAILQWDSEAQVPSGWIVDCTAIEKTWKDLAFELSSSQDESTFLIVTSNGISRFCSCLVRNPKLFREKYSIKMKTASVSILEYESPYWEPTLWGYRPE